MPAYIVGKAVHNTHWELVLRGSRTSAVVQRDSRNASQVVAHGAQRTRLEKRFAELLATSQRSTRHPKISMHCTPDGALTLDCVVTYVHTTGVNVQARIQVVQCVAHAIQLLPERVAVLVFCVGSHFVGGRGNVELGCKQQTGVSSSLPPTKVIAKHER